MAYKNTLKHKARTVLARSAGALPRFRGEGRLLLLLDEFLTDYSDSQSYIVKGVLNEHVPFEFDLRAWGQKFAYYYSEWEGDYVRILRNLYQKRGGAFVDVGSSIGLYVCCLGEAVLAAGEKIFSIEPIPFNLERQKRNVSLIKGLNSALVYLPVAVGAESGKLRIHADQSHADNNAFVSDDGEHNIAVHRLDEILMDAVSSNIGVIKMDVEGWEPEVIRGATEIIRRHRPIIFGEFLRERMDIYGFDMKYVRELLVEELEYSIYAVYQGELVALDNIGNHENIFFLPI